MLCTFHANIQDFDLFQTNLSYLTRADSPAWHYCREMLGNDHSKYYIIIIVLSLFSERLVLLRAEDWNKDPEVIIDFALVEA